MKKSAATGLLVGILIAAVELVHTRYQALEKTLD